MDLALLGFNLNFAPVADVHSNPQNPIIGDRAFSSDPRVVIEMCQAYLDGLEPRGVAGCIKHFPGHGDTDLDSHLALPIVRHDLERLRRVELRPFRELSKRANLVMTAHVLFEALDATCPATQSPQVCTELLRKEFGYRGVLVSDDLEMKALADRASVEENAVTTLLAGSDLLLICSDTEWQARARQALCEEAGRSPSFKARVTEAWTRSRALLDRFEAKPAATLDVQALSARASALGDALEALNVD
jgi:beta-N-acetylhexosaminidase